MDIKRGDVYYADLSPVTGAEEGGIRPVLVVSDDNSKDTVIVAVITSRPTGDKYPAVVPFNDGGMFSQTILLNHLRTIDKKRLKDFMCSLGSELMQEVNKALCFSLGL